MARISFRKLPDPPPAKPEEPAPSHLDDLSVACPSCNAPIGQECSSRDGGGFYVPPHLDRIRAARAASAQTVNLMPGVVDDPLGPLQVHCEQCGAFPEASCIHEFDHRPVSYFHAPREVLAQDVNRARNTPPTQTTVAVDPAQPGTDQTISTPVTWLEATEIECPSCGASAGSDCTINNGTSWSHPHTSRVARRRRIFESNFSVAPAAPTSAIAQYLTVPCRACNAGIGEECHPTEPANQRRVTGGSHFLRAVDSNIQGGRASQDQTDPFDGD